MEMKLEVVSSVAVQGKKPWSRYAWLRGSTGSDIFDGLFLLDNTRISQLSLATGKTSRSLHSLSRTRLALTCASQSGTVLAGLTVHGHMFTCLQPSQQLATYISPLSTPAPRLEYLNGCHLCVSDSGEHALLVTNKLDLYLWELREGQHSEWWKLPVPGDIGLPPTSTRHAATDTSFYVHQVIGNCCECDIVYTSQETNETTIGSCLLTWKAITSESQCTSVSTTEAGVQVSQKDIQGDDSEQRDDSVGKNASISRARNSNRPLLDRTNLEYTTPSASSDQSVPATKTIPVHVQWKTCTVSQSNTSHQQSPQGRGCYVVKLSPTGRVTAAAINHDNAVDTHIVFTDLQNEVSVSSHIYTDRNNTMTGRTFWITSLAWSGDGLLLAAMTRRGCLALLPRFGPPLKLVSAGCGVDMGPAQFLPLHPLITVQASKSGVNVTDHETSESSERDPLRQRFSVASHPHHPAVVCSDGYCLTILQLPSSANTLPQLVCSLVHAGHRLLGLTEVQSLHTDTNNDDTSADVHPSTVGSKSVLHGETVLNIPDLRGRSDLGLHHTVSRYSISSVGEGNSHCLPCTKSSEQASDRVRKQLARAYLRAAWSLLLSSGCFQPGNGVYPRVISANQVKSVLSEMKIAWNITVTALASFHSSLVDRHESDDSIISTLSLAHLDKCDHKSLKMVYKLASSYLMSLLSGLLREHRGFVSSKTHTVLSVKTYLESATTGLRTFWKMFHRIVVQLTEVYGQLGSKLQQTFSLLLRILMKICGLLSADMLSCNKLAQEELNSGPEVQGLQRREASILHQSMAESITAASTILCSTKNILTAYFNNSVDTMVVLTGVEAGSSGEAGIGSSHEGTHGCLQGEEDQERTPSVEHVTPDTQVTGGAESMTTVTSSLEHVTPDTELTSGSVTTDVTVSSSLEHVTPHTISSSDNMTEVTLVLDDTAVSITTVTPDMDSVTLTDSTLHAEDLDVPDTCQLSPSMACDEMGHSYFRPGQQSFPLLNVNMPHKEEDQAVLQISLLALANSALSLTVTNAGDDDSAAVASEDSSVRAGSGLECDLTDSQSTGELPSQFTFSVGELGSGVSPHSTIDRPSLIETTTVASPLARGTSAENTYPLLHLQLSDTTQYSVEQPSHTIKTASSSPQIDFPPLSTVEQTPPSYDQSLTATDQPPSSNEHPLTSSVLPPASGDQPPDQPPASGDQPPDQPPASDEQPPSNDKQPVAGIDHLSPTTESQQTNTETIPHSHMVQKDPITEQLVLHSPEQLPPTHEPSSPPAPCHLDHQPSHQPLNVGGLNHTARSSETVLATTITPHRVQSVQCVVVGGTREGILAEEVDGGVSRGAAVEDTGGGSEEGEEGCEGVGVGVGDGGNREGRRGDVCGEVVEAGDSTNGVETGNRGGSIEGEGVAAVCVGEEEEKTSHSSNGDPGEKAVCAGSSGKGEGDGRSGMPQRKSVPRHTRESLHSMSDHSLGTSLPPTITGRSDQDLGNQETDIGRIVRSEMKRFLQVQQHQLMKILSGSNAQSTPTPFVAPQASCQDSEHERQSSLSSSCLSIRHLQRENTTPPTAAPPPLLLAAALPTHHTTTHPPAKHTNTHRRNRTELSLASSPPLLQLDTNDRQKTCVEELIPPVPVARPALSSSNMPLLTVDRTAEDRLLPPLVQVPTPSQVPSGPPTAQVTLPLLHCRPSIPPATFLPMPHHSSTPHSMGTPGGPEHGRLNHRLHTPLQLLVPAGDNLPPLPLLPLIVPHRESLQLLPTSVLLQNQPPELMSYKAKQSTGVSQTNYDELHQPQGHTQHELQPHSGTQPGHDTRPKDHSGGVMHSKDKSECDAHSKNRPHSGGQADHWPDGDILLSSIDEQLGVVAAVDQLTIVGRTPRHVSDTGSKICSSHQMEEMLPSDPEPSAGTSHFQSSSEYLHVPPHCSPQSQPGSAGVPGLTQHTPSSCDHPGVNMKTSCIPNSHREDVPSLEGTNDHQLIPIAGFPSSETEVIAGDQPSGQTADSATQTGAWQSSAELVERKFLHVVDISSDDEETPSLSGEEGSTVVGDDHSLQGQPLLDGEGERQGEGGGEKGEESNLKKPIESYGYSTAQREEHLRAETKGQPGQEAGAAVLQGCSEEEGGRGGVRDVARREVLNQLQHLECQLSAIENTARTVQSELLVSNKLLGTIDELQTVRETAPSLQPHNTQQTQVENHPPPRTSALPATRRPDDPSRTGQPAKRESRTQSTAPTVSHTVSLPAPTPASNHHPVAPSPLGHLSPPHCVPIVTQHITRHRASQSGPHGVTNQSASRAQHLAPPHKESPGLPLSGRHSKQTLKKCVSAKKRERSSSSEQSGHRSTQQKPLVEMVSGIRDSKRLQGQDHMNQRMEDALSLMEDILSAELPSVSAPLHTTAANRRPYPSTADKPPVCRRTADDVINIATEYGPSHPKCWSGTEGLTEQEQIKIAHMMATTELSSASSGSVASHIDWELVDKLIDN